LFVWTVPSTAVAGPNSDRQQLLLVVPLGIVAVTVCVPALAAILYHRLTPTELPPANPPSVHVSPDESVGVDGWVIAVSVTVRRTRVSPAATPLSVLTLLVVPEA
jgi:hypothetical protein